MRKKIFLLKVFCICTFFGFSQHSINDYLQAAVKNSPVYIDNQNQIQSLAFDSMLIRGGLKPQVSFNSTNMYAPVINGYGYDEVITNGGNYNALLGINYTIVGKNNLNNQYASLFIQKQILELKTKLSERDLKQTVTAQYITVYGQQQLLSNSEKILEVLKNEDLILKNITEKGLYRQTDYLSFLVGYKQQKLSSSQQKLQAQNDLYVLNYLCGITDTTYVILPDPALSTSPVFNGEQPIQFRQFILDSLKLQNSIEQIKFNYKPKLSLLGDAGYNTTFTYHAEKNFGASVGLNFSIPIYYGNQRKFQLEKFRLSENTRMSYADYFRKQYSMKQMQLQKQISETEMLIIEAQEQLKISETLLAANNKLLETGDMRITDYVISVTNYITSRSTEQQLITSKMQLINQYNFLSY
ncbi:MAG: TolC family protein [Bacteroidia bacterium]